MDFRLGNSSFGTVKSTKNADLDKLGHSDYCIAFDACWQFSLLNGSSRPAEATITVEDKYSVNITKSRKKI